jgi:hypothetical protein
VEETSPKRQKDETEESKHFSRAHPPNVLRAGGELGIDVVKLNPAGTIGKSVNEKLHHLALPMVRWGLVGKDEDARLGHSEDANSVWKRTGAITWLSMVD